MTKEESQTGRVTTQGHTGQRDSSGTDWTLAGAWLQFFFFRSWGPKCRVEGEDPALNLRVCAVTDCVFPHTKLKFKENVLFRQSS